VCCYGAVTDNIVIILHNSVWRGSGMLTVLNDAVLYSSVRCGSGMLIDDVLTINVGSFVHSMEFCRITSPVVKRRSEMSVRYRRIVTHDVVIMTGHSNGRIRAWDAKTGETCCLN